MYFRPKKKAPAAIKATPAMAPMTMPAIAPPEREEDDIGVIAAPIRG